MNKTRKIFWVLLGLLLAVLIVLLLHKNQASRSDVVSVRATTENQTNAGVLPPIAVPSQTGHNASTKTNTPVRDKSWIDSLSREEKWRLAALDRNFPIDFWGKVVDQNGAPLNDVKIVVDTRTITIASSGQPYTAFPKTNFITGNDGLFEIHGMMGDVLAIEAMDKEGYEKEPGTLRGFSYDPSQHFTLSSDNPVVFRLWQKGLKQPLISGDKIFKFIPDGRPYSIDLMTGTIYEAKNSEGDLQFWLKRPEEAKRRQPYDWSFGVRPQNGVILREFSEEYYDMTLAPTDGYTNTYESYHKASENRWDDGEGHDRFFIKIHDGKIYGRILINVNSFYEPNTGQGRLEIEYVINPSGSPILR